MTPTWKETALKAIRLKLDTCDLVEADISTNNETREVLMVIKMTKPIKEEEER